MHRFDTFDQGNRDSRVARGQGTVVSDQALAQGSCKENTESDWKNMNQIEVFSIYIKMVFKC